MKTDGNRLASEIRKRRNDLGLTIEEAARRAGVGTKTWCRYEAGGAIRKDKGKGVCKALNWRGWPDFCDTVEEKNDWKSYQEHEAWSSFLAENYGAGAASAFVVGSDMLLDYIEQDMEDLAHMPQGAHIGQLDSSFLVGELPAQFLLRYDYEFLYQLRCELVHMRSCAGQGMALKAYTVMEELIIYMCYNISTIADELGMELGPLDDIWTDGEWVFDLFSDADVITFLYSDMCIDESCTYHFAHWCERQFWVNKLEGEEDMPALSMFFGIIVRMQSERGGKHHKAHIHAMYGDYEIVIALDGEILEGEFPKRQLKMLEGWMAIHEDELAANWRMLSDGDGYFKIDPLR